MAKLTNTRLRTNDFLVPGAGIQGICIALELAKNGKHVTVKDQDSKPFNCASLRNEGKIHIGLVYINDSSIATPTLMLKASMVTGKYGDVVIKKDGTAYLKVSDRMSGLEQ